MKLDPQTIRNTRDTVLFVLGAYLAVYEVQFSPPPVEVQSLILAAACLGLPGVLRA